jgi:hypothetical protein
MRGPAEEPEGDDDNLTKWRLKELEREASAQDARLDSLEAWKNWVIGAAAALGLAIGAFAKQVWEFLSGHH